MAEKIKRIPGLHTFSKYTLQFRHLVNEIEWILMALDIQYQNIFCD